MKKFWLNFFGGLIACALCLGMLLVLSRLSGAARPQDTNFSFFWLAGRMTLQGQNPYDETQYLAGHDTYQIGWRPNKIFPYPLPLALLCVPLGLFSLEDAHRLWQGLTLLIVALTIYVTLRQWARPAQHRLFFPLLIASFFFGPLYLSLETGSIGALSLLAVLLGGLALQKEKPLLAGIFFSLTILKPPQGLTILILLGIWFLARKNWKAIYGLALGGIMLLALGLIQDPLWLTKFLHASGAVMDRTQGVQSNVWAFAYLACGGATPCSNLLGAAGSLTLLGLGGYFLWRKQAQLTAFEALSFIIPIGFVSTVYLWEYDQILYILPLVWVIGQFVQKTKSYLHAFLFLILIIFYAFFAVSELGATQRDLWSLGNTLILLAGFWLASILDEKPERALRAVSKR
ncbi:MAG: DUF2029 domain-containing protein [Anaerolineales bacterium]|nr:DUF2029 domain-containing protein [Anaerolineales bacterium]